MTETSRRIVPGRPLPRRDALKLLASLRSRTEWDLDDPAAFYCGI